MFLCVEFYKGTEFYKVLDLSCKVYQAKVKNHEFKVWQHNNPKTWPNLSILKSVYDQFTSDFR